MPRAAAAPGSRPAIDPATPGVACAGHQVKVSLPLLPDELGDELGVVAGVRVHDHDEVAGGVLDPVDVGRAEAELLSSGSQNDPLLAVNLLELLGDIQGPVRTAVIDHDDLEVNVRLSEVLDQQPDDDREVVTLIVGGEQHGVLPWPWTV